MSLIIGAKGFPMLKKGYPTVSDKYDIAGAVLTGDNTVEFGQLVKFSDNTGYYEKFTGGELVDIAGFVVATNVKLKEWNEDKVYTYPGEAFNLLIKGFIAIELDEGATEAQIKANAQVYVILATGKLTTADKADDGTIVALTNVVFTGIYETHGEAIYAEIMVK